jgi:hypothetical protein
LIWRVAEAEAEHNFSVLASPLALPMLFDHQPVVRPRCAPQRFRPEEQPFIEAFWAAHHQLLIKAGRCCAKMFSAPGVLVFVVMQQFEQERQLREGDAGRVRCPFDLCCSNPLEAP